MDGTVEAMVRSCVSGRCERRRESQRQHSRGSKPRHILLLRFTETRLGLFEAFHPRETMRSHRYRRTRFNIGTS
jgi:hypothetical protein